MGLRNQRNMMVQTKEQYCFLYFALEMALTAMKTVSLQRLPRLYHTPLISLFIG
jgi:protein tyrosine phosphatase